MAAQPDSRPSAKRQRNAQLLAEVLEDHEHRLRHQARRHVELPDDAEDALQSAFALFIERYKGVGEPLAWLYTTVKREAWALRRQSSRRYERFSFELDGNTAEIDLGQTFPSEAPGPAEKLERDEQLSARRQALATLKQDELRALWLLGLGLSYAEICEMTGWTYTKVNRCVSEGRVALRRTDCG